jgi:glycosyltransferase involved in cell wall biosynthesis
MKQPLLSVIIRFHDETTLAMLEQALFSLAVQSYTEIQIVLMVQNGSDALFVRLHELLAVQPFIAPMPHRIIKVEVAAGQDGRSVLLNRGMEAAEGRFLAFLDYDDVMYQHAYSLMIAQLQQSGAAVVVAGCRKAHQNAVLGGGYYIRRKEPYLDRMRTKFDLFAENFIPFHSFVIDRDAVELGDLHFNETLFCYEDYVFLLTLASRYRFDFALLDQPVAEYRIRTDGTNSIAAYSGCTVKQQAWDSAKAYVEGIKEGLVTSVTIAEIAALVAERNRLQAQVGPGVSGDYVVHLVNRLRAVIRRYPRIKSMLLAGLMMGWRMKQRWRRR